MVSSRFTHTSVLATDLDASTEFYETVFGMERVPAPNFSVPVHWLRCGDRQLHLFERDIDPVDYYHFGLHVDDFEGVYETIRDHDIASFDVVGGEGDEVVDQTPDVYELPDGSVQMYIRDPTGNLVEVNAPDVDDVDRSIVTDIVDRNDLRPQTGEAAASVLYHDELLETVGSGTSAGTD
jgi:catechol 2,3-dioxygenase-like lactoylglutathione lyase family enzyme